MIPKLAEKLLVEVAGKIGDDEKRKAKDNPEKWLIALLMNISKDVTDVSSMLETTVRFSFFDDTMLRAGRLLARKKRRHTNGKRKDNRTVPSGR